ncbi:MAG: hypothetical protein ACTSYD_01440 [Candidatus Heimdallarchaeaceae archaeon]
MSSRHKLNSHYGACKKAKEFADLMKNVESLLKDKYVKGEFTSPKQINLVKQSEMEKQIADINRQLGEIRGLLRKLLERE